MRCDHLLCLVIFTPLLRLLLLLNFLSDWLWLRDDCNGFGLVMEKFEGLWFDLVLFLELFALIRVDVHPSHYTKKRLGEI